MERAIREKQYRIYCVCQGLGFGRYTNRMLRREHVTFSHGIRSLSWIFFRFTHKISLVRPRPFRPLKGTPKWSFESLPAPITKKKKKRGFFFLRRGGGGPAHKKK